MIFTTYWVRNVKYVDRDDVHYYISTTVRKSSKLGNAIFDVFSNQAH